MKIFDPKAIEILSDKYGRTEPMTDELIKKNEHILLAMEQYASTKAEEVKKISVAFAIHMKKDILMLSDLKDNSRWNKMFDEWYTQYKLSQI